MAYLTLYRKFRPQKFDEIIGQDHIVTTLTNQINSGKIANAYLFCGTRGTGKTSCAKIFARAINCENPVNGSPCGKCDTCLAYSKGGSLDILEIDAASNNRVDEIRDLREKIKYCPTVGKYKVYIIDEVHMLTESAFNALLKTLEEPPKHAVFILATTEPQKLPATILSRCVRFDFKLINEENLILQLQNIFKLENIVYDLESLKLIAKMAEGSDRDCLSLAEMCVSFCDGKLSYDKCIECLGITDSLTLQNLARDIIENNPTDILTAINNLSLAGKNLSNTMKDLSIYFKNLITAKLIPNANDILSLPVKDFEILEDLSKKMETQNLINILNKLNSIEDKLRYSNNIRVIVETTLLECIFLNDDVVSLTSRVEKLEKLLNSNELILLNSQNSTSTSKIVIEKSNVNDTIEKVVKIENNEIKPLTKLEIEELRKKLDNKLIVEGE